MNNHSALVRNTIATAFFLLAGVALAWTGPTASPPNNNVTALTDMTVANTGVGQSNAGGIIERYIDGNNRGVMQVRGGIDGTTVPSDAVLNLGGNGSLAYSIDAVAGIKTASLEAAKTPYVGVYLNACGNACPGYHTLNQWYDIGLSYTHSISNNDTSTFTTSTNGRVTVNKTGTYFIRVHMMEVPAASASGEYGCPFINGSATCPVAEGGYKYVYMPAGWWTSTVHEFAMQISAGTTVSYGYYPNAALSDWGHDGYTGMEIVRLN